MKDKDEQTALIGMAIGAAVISLVATQKQINQGSIVDELVRLGRQKGDGVEDEVFVQAARLVSKGTWPAGIPPGSPVCPFYFGFYFPNAARRAALIPFLKRYRRALSLPAFC